MRANLLFAALVCVASRGIHGLLFAPSGYRDVQQNYYEMMTQCEREGGECIDVNLDAPSPAGPSDSTDPPPTLPPIPPQTFLALTPPPPKKPIYNILPSVNPFVPFVPQNPPMVFPQRGTTRAPLPVWRQPQVPQLLPQFIPRMAPPQQPTPAPFRPRMVPPVPRQLVPQVAPSMMPQFPTFRENPRMRFPSAPRSVPPATQPSEVPHVAPTMFNPTYPPMRMNQPPMPRPAPLPQINQEPPPMVNHPPPPPTPQSNMLYFPKASPQPASRASGVKRPIEPLNTTKPPRTIRIVHIERELPESRQKRAVSADHLVYLYSECRGGWELDLGCGNRGGNVCCYPASARRRRR